MLQFILLQYLLFGRKRNHRLRSVGTADEQSSWHGKPQVISTVLHRLLFGRLPFTVSSSAASAVITSAYQLLVDDGVAWSHQQFTGVNLSNAPRLETPLFKVQGFPCFWAPTFTQMQFFAYYEAVFHSATNNKMTKWDSCHFHLNQAIKDASCEQKLFEFLALAFD